MKTKLLYLIVLVFSLQEFHAQVGVGTTNPDATLDIEASDVANPASNDGILIPRIDDFPSVNPTVNQDGMMVFVTGNGSPAKGFYYWDNATTSWLSIQGNEDTDWLRTGTGGPASNISDNIYTLGQVQIGNVNVTNTSSLRVTSDLTSNFSGLQLLHTGSDSGQIGYGFYNQSTITDAIRFSNFYNANSGTHNSTHYGFENFFINNGTGVKVGLYNEFDLSAPNGNKKGVYNRFEGGNSEIYGIDNSMPGAWTVAGNIYGINNNIRSGGNGQHYGVKTELDGSGSGSKYGYFVDISSTAGGTHYGIFSDVRNTSGYAAYFRGRVSFGNDGIDRYFMPAQDGTTNQLITTNGFGQLNFVDASSVFTDTNTDNQNLTTATLTGTTLNLGIQNGTGTSVNLASLTDDNDWVTVGANIERQSGDVYIGDTNTTNNSLYVSGSIIDWDNTTYNMDLNATSNLARLELDSGISSFPALTIGDNNTGFYSASPGEIAHSGNGTLTFNIFSDGEITFRGSSPSLYDFSSYNIYENAGVMMGTSNSNSPLLYGFIQNDANDDIAEFEVLSGNSGFSHSAVYAHSNIGSNEARLAYNATGTSYAVHAVSPNNFAGYFRGDVQFGKNTTNRYFLPENDGTAGQVMTTDGAGNVTFQDSYNGDSDWFEVGSTNAPSSLNDDKYTGGSLSIGKNTAAVAKVDIETNDDLSSLFLVNNTNTAGIKNGIVNVVNGTTSPIKHGIANTFNNNANGILEVGVLNNIESRGSVNLVGYSNFYTTTSNNNNGYFIGFQNTVGDQHQGSTTGLINSFNSNSGSNSVIGVKNFIDATGGGNHYGSFTEINSSGSGVKYGHNVTISTTSGGTHYGFYADVQKASGYAGYFIGRTSLGNTTSNRYTMPASDGTNGQVLTTDGTGNTSWENLPSASLSLARITMSADQSFTTSTWQKLNFDTVDFDLNSEFNTTTDEFDITTTGYYRINASWRSTNTSTSTSAFGIGIVVNGVFEGAVNFNNSGSGYVFRSINRILDLSAGDSVEIQILNTGPIDVFSNDIVTSFEIEQIR